MTIYTSSKNFQPGLIGPYVGWKPGYSFSHKSCHDCNTSCSSGHCDVRHEIDLGLTQTIGYDWNHELGGVGDCKIVNSQWLKQKEASVPLNFTDSKLESNQASIKVSGGIFGGEYTLINRVTTEEGNQLQKVFCITVTGNAIGTLTNIDTEKCPTTVVSDDKIITTAPTNVEVSYCISTGLYLNKDLFQHSACKVTFTLLTGVAQLITNDKSYNITTTPLTIENGGKELESIILNVGDCSSVNYSVENC